MGLNTFGGFPVDSDGKKIHLKCGRPGFDPWIRKIPWRMEQLSSVQFSSVQLLSCVWLCDPMDCRTPASLSITNSKSLLKLMSISRSCHLTSPVGMSLGNRYLLQYSDLENSMDCIVHRFANNRHEWGTYISCHFKICLQFLFEVKLTSRWN